jgi:hypothetical protein
MTDLFGRATAGVYAEVISQLYDSSDKRIREAVSNAFDANAKEVRISVYKERTEPSKVIIRDNGDGMDADDFRDKYVCMGGGDNYQNRFTIGRIGIGALSIFALGDSITVNTRKKGSNKVVTAHLSLASVKSAVQHATPLEDVKLGSITDERSALETEGPHFTEIIIEDLTREARSAFDNEDKTKELISILERILPLSYRDDDPLFGHIAPDLRDKLVIGNKYVINVILHVPHLEINNLRLSRRTVYSVDETQIETLIPIYPFASFDGAADKDLCVYGYLYISKGVQLPKEWQGINARVKNVTIERNTYFGYEEDAAARVRIGGEVFIDNIDENRAIQSNRSGFAIENTDYRLIARYMHLMIARAIAEVRKSSRIDSIIKQIVVPVKKLRDMCNHISKIEDAKKNADVFQEVSDLDVQIVKMLRFSLEDKLKENLQREVKIDPEVLWSRILASLYYIQREDDDYYTVQVHEDLKEFKFDVGGNTIEYVMGRCGEDKPVVVKEERAVYINLDNPVLNGGDVTKLDLGFLEVVLILYLNYLRCDGSARDLYTKAIADLSA